MKHIINAALALERSGLLIELVDKRTGRVIATYSAHTHGGWAKYVGSNSGFQIASFDVDHEVVKDAERIAQAVNCPLEVFP